MNIELLMSHEPTNFLKTFLLPSPLNIEHHKKKIMKIFIFLFIYGFIIQGNYIVLLLINSFELSTKRALSFLRRADFPQIKLFKQQ